MFLRVFAALAIVAGLTAFAPAPLPRTERKVRGTNDVALLQGTWKVVAYERPGLKGAVKVGTAISNVRIADGKWTFLRKDGNDLTPTVSYDLKINPKTAPKKMDMVRDMGGGNVFTLKGIYKFEGSKLKVMYVTSTIIRAAAGAGPGAGVGAGAVMAQVEAGPLSFENPPSNAILFTLERER